MLESLIGLAVVALVVGIVAWIVLLLLGKLPIEEPFGQIVRGLVIIIAVLIVLFKALPLLGVSI